MAEIDRALFAVDVRHALDTRDLSYRHAVLAWPVLNVAMLSRACSEQVLSAGNFLALCQVFDLDPFRYLVSTSRAIQSPAALGAPVGRLMTGDGRSALPPAADGDAKTKRNQSVSAIVSREAGCDSVRLGE